MLIDKAEIERVKRANELVGFIAAAASVSEPGLTREAKQTAKLLESLLRGQITTDASSSPDYMVSGAHPYKWSEDDQAVRHQEAVDEGIVP